MQNVRIYQSTADLVVWLPASQFCVLHVIMSQPRSAALFTGLSSKLHYIMSMLNQVAFKSPEVSNWCTRSCSEL
jgi:hypothetical protein